MEEDYNWTRDGILVQKAMDNTWKPFANRYVMKVKQHSIESNKLKSMELSKGDLMIRILMSRTNPFDCYYYSINKKCKFSFLLKLFDSFIPKNKNFIWLCEQNGLWLPDKKEDKERRWTTRMHNYIFLLEKYCSELLETGDICGWLAKYQPNT